MSLCCGAVSATRTPSTNEYTPDTELIAVFSRSIDELKQGLRDLFSLGGDKNNGAGAGAAKRGPKILVERKTTRLERTLEPRWREIVNDIPSEIAAQFRYIQFEVWHASASALGGLDPDFMGQAVVSVETIREQLVIQKTTSFAPGAVGVGASPTKHENRIRLELKLNARPDRPKDKVRGSLIVYIKYQQIDVDSAIAAAALRKANEGKKDSEDLASLLTRTLSFGLVDSKAPPKPKPHAQAGSGSSAANTTETGGDANTTAGEGGKPQKRGGGQSAKDKRLANLQEGEGEEQECSIM